MVSLMIEPLKEDREGSRPVWVNWEAPDWDAARDYRRIHGEIKELDSGPLTKGMGFIGRASDDS